MRSRPRNADVTSRSTNSGAASSSPRRRARAVSPQIPSSTKTATRTPASVTITIRPDDGIDVVETYRSPRSASCAFKNLIKRWSISLFDEVLQEVFLQRLMRGRGPFPQHRMGAFGYTLDLDARHGAPFWRHWRQNASSHERGSPANSCRAITIRWIWLVPS